MSFTILGLRERNGQSVTLNSNSVMLSLVVTHTVSPTTLLTKTVIHTFEGWGTQYHSLSAGVNCFDATDFIVESVCENEWRLEHCLEGSRKHNWSTSD